MLEQAAGFAFLSALSPTVLLVAAAYLRSPGPRRTLLYFLVGAVAMTGVMSVVILAALHAGGLGEPRHGQARYGLRLGLGVLALAVALAMARRAPRPNSPGRTRPKSPGRTRPGMVTRLVERPRPVTAFAAGVVLFGPSVSFVAAVQVIGTSSAHPWLIVAALIMVVVIDAMLVWLPLVFYLIAPEATTRQVTAAGTWLRAHGQVVLVTALAVAGVFLVGNGAAGLAG